MLNRCFALSIICALGFSFSALAGAQDGSRKNLKSELSTKAGAKQVADKISRVSVKELVKLLTDAEAAKQSKVSVVDVNGKKARSKYGVIPNAILLTSSSQYDVNKELPPNKEDTYVFYCSNERCGASKKAALRAKREGYTDVRVLPAGIMGWSKAGQNTAPPKS
jgi:rhodanese-related sulfurtransferase